MVQLKIHKVKNQTIANIMDQTFHAIKCLGNEKLHVLSPRLIAYIQELVIDSISIPFDDSINTRALHYSTRRLCSGYIPK